jgi:anti-sigma factor RsiW
MTCPLQTEETYLLLDYSSGRLDAARTAALADHMEGCPGCTRFAMEQKAVWKALDEWEPAPVNMDFNRRLWQRIDAAAAVPWYKNFGEIWKPAIPLTAAILVIAAGFLLDHPHGTQTRVPGVTVQEANQVEQTLDDIQLLDQLDIVNSKTM